LRTYEALYIIRPDLTDEETQAVALEVEGLITSNGGVIVRPEVWGKKRLAYEVKHFNEGVYVLLRFQAEAEFPKILEQYFRISDQVIRNLVVYFDEQMLRLEAEQEILRQEQIARAAATGERDGDDDRPRRRSRDDRDDRDDDDDDD
jgi:small subunit ribosomal protein S6